MILSLQILPQHVGYKYFVHGNPTLATIFAQLCNSNLPGDLARELFKPSKDVATSLLVCIIKHCEVLDIVFFLCITSEVW